MHPPVDEDGAALDGGVTEDGCGADVAAADEDDGEEDDGDDETAALDAWDAGGALVVPAADEDVALRDEDARPLVASDEAPRELDVLPLLVEAGTLLPPEALAAPLEVFPTAPDEAVRDAVLVPLLLPAPTRHTPSRHTSPPAHAAGQGRPHRPSWHS